MFFVYVLVRGCILLCIRFNARVLCVCSCGTVLYVRLCVRILLRVCSCVGVLMCVSLVHVCVFVSPRVFVCMCVSVCVRVHLCIFS